jgi:hypothetical protein
MTRRLRSLQQAGIVGGSGGMNDANEEQSFFRVSGIGHQA